MSGIFGIFNRNDEPVSAEILQNMHEAMSYWQPDTSGIWREGAVGLGHTMLWNTPESKLENLPNKQDQLVITMDARLDNREELAQKLGMTKRPLKQITESDFILAAYQQWGEECPKYLLGDFSFVIWDEKRQQLFCARDHIGIKQFYYHLSEDRFIFSNHIYGVIAHSDIPKTLDDTMIAYYLRDEEYIYNQTFFKAIKKLPPASSLIIGPNSQSQSVYWKPEDAPKITLNSDSKYSSMLFELLEKAVHARLRSDYVISSHLSGGLDSSAIASIAARHLKKSNKQLNAYNWITEPIINGTDPKYYEWRYSKLLAEQEGIIHHSIELDEHKLSDIFFNHDITTNDTTDLWYEFPIRQHIRKRGGRILLSGWGGDELVTYVGKGYLSELFYNGQIKKSFVKFKEEINFKSKNLSFLQILKRFIKLIIVESFPTTVLCLLKKSLCINSLPVNNSPPEFTTFTNHLKPLKKGYNATTVNKRQLKMFHAGHLQSRVESWSVSGMSDKIEYAYPLLDKRLVEFALNIPAELYIKNGCRRFIFRHAMKGILPDEIRLHKEKDEPHRVKIFHDLVLRSLKTAIIKSKKNDTHPYIYQKHLLKAVNKLSLGQLQNRDEKIEKLECISRALFVYNLDSLRYTNSSK